MLACIACSKHEPEDGGDDAAARAPGNPSSKDAVKSLTSQLKDMVLKFSGTYRHSKGSSLGKSKSKSLLRHNNHHHRSSYVGKDVASDASAQYDYLRAAAGSSSWTPAWDFSSYTNNYADEEESSHGGKWMAQGEGEEDEVVLEEEGEPKEWMAQVEPGVHITFVSLPGGAGNDLKRIRFSREMFNKWQAQRWWGENYDRIMELYNVRRFSRQAFPTPPRSDDGERDSAYYSSYSPANPPPVDKERLTRNTYGPPPVTSGFKGHPYFTPVPDPSHHILLPHYFNPPPAAYAAPAGVSGVKGESSSFEASRTTTSSRDEAASVSISNASDLDVTEWVEHDEPGVSITVRELADGTRELRRVRFSRERFGEARAKLWWEENRERIQAQYL